MPTIVRYLVVFVIAVVWLVAMFSLAWFVLPPVKACPSVSCGDFESGAAPLFGHGNFTWPQFIVMVLGLAGFVVIMVLGAIRFARQPKLRHHRRGTVPEPSPRMAGPGA
jgi:NADH:ubiquinone oxidoreductase subunit 3 (subunit A)